MSEAPVKITEAEAVGMRFDFEALVAWVLHFLGADAEDPVSHTFLSFLSFLSFLFFSMFRIHLIVLLD